jgi:hypothetical protein
MKLHAPALLLMSFWFFQSPTSQAHEVRIEDPCLPGSALKTLDVPPKSEPSQKETAGSVTLEALGRSGLPFKASEAGVQSIANTPESLESIEFETESVFRIHGWCYEVDGVQPGLMPGEFKLPAGPHSIRWFFGYARYRDGNWEGYCETDRTLSSYCQSL